jgi:hypothetical protein
MKPGYPALSDQFLDGPLGHALRYLAPSERDALRQLVFEDYADARGHEPSVKLSIRLPASLALRLELERANVKRALRRRRATRSDTLRYLLEQQLASLDSNKSPDCGTCGSELGADRRATPPR